MDDIKETDGLPFEHIETLVLCWASRKGILTHSNPSTQFLKTVSEIGELADNLAKGRDVRDDIGDAIVTLIILAKMKSTNVSECLRIAYEEIKGREGRMVNGTFVKDGDTDREDSGEDVKINPNGNVVD